MPILVPVIRQCAFKELVAALTVKEGEEEEHEQWRKDIKIAFS